MYIEQVEQLEKGRRRIVFDSGEHLMLYKGEVRSYGLKEGMEISSECYRELLSDVVGKRATKRAMHLLERQDRTEFQLREKLRQSDYPEEAIEQALSYVRSYHYVDDLRYACSYAHCQKEKKSKRRLWQDLQKKGVAGELIEQALLQEGNEDETEAIQRLLEKKGYTSDMPKEQANKIYQFLLRRGYRSSDILYVMRTEYLT